MSEEEAPLEEVSRKPMHYKGIWAGDMVLRNDGFTEFCIDPSHPDPAMVQIFLLIKGFKPDPDDNMKFLHNTLEVLDAEEASNEQD